MNDADLKTEVRDFWNKESCGERYASGDAEKEYYESHSKARYDLESYIADFAKFNEGYNKDVLEIGVGMGADHLEWAKSKPKSLTGIDLTPRAVEHTKKKLALYHLKSELKVADAEKLPFADNSFDLIYSWGVLHHSPDTPKSVDEVFRVLRPGGIAKIMIYHKYSLIGYMLWVRSAMPLASMATTMFWLPKRCAHLEITSGSSTADVFNETLSAPSSRSMRASSGLRTPPPTVNGMKT